MRRPDVEDAISTEANRRERRRHAGFQNGTAPGPTKSGSGKTARNWLGNLDPTRMGLEHWKYYENGPISIPALGATRWGHR